MPSAAGSLCKTETDNEHADASAAGAHPDLFLPGGGGGADCEATYNLSWILKIML